DDDAEDEDHIQFGDQVFQEFKECFKNVDYMLQKGWGRDMISASHIPLLFWLHHLGSAANSGDI
ncbi:hypothetical protein ACH5RR_002935, partial [Cinchona calisaya]